MDKNKTYVPSFNKVLQLGIVVADLDKTIQTYENVYGIGPWLRKEPVPHDEPDLRLYEKPVRTFGVKYALCKLDNLDIELLQPINGIESDYSRFLKEHGEGVHHIAIKQTDEFINILEKRNIKEVHGGTVASTGRLFRYMDTRDDLKIITEFYIDK